MKSLRQYLNSLENKTPIEDKKLLDNSYVKDEMKRQWNSIPEETVETLQEREHIWQSLSSRIFGNKYLKRYRLYKITAIAATLLLCIASGALLTNLLTEKNRNMHIVSTGKQDMNSLLLSDGTKVKIGAGSKLIYPESFAQGKRTVQLDGQAFFDVVANPEKPFTVMAGEVTVTALGTSFEIFCDKHNNKVETILLTGKVLVDYKNSVTGKTKSSMLSPDRILTVALNTGEMKVYTKNSDEYTAWRDYEGLNFINETLSTIIPRLEYWYGAKIVCDSEKILNERFSFKVRNESLERILDNMSSTSFIKYEKDDNLLYKLFE